MQLTILEHFNHRWACEQRSFDLFLARVLLRLNQPEEAPREPVRLEKRPTEDAFGNSITLMEIRADGVAVIPVSGPMSKRVSAYDKWAWGLVDYEDIAADVDMSVEMGAKALLFDMNSPGGSVLGLPELSSLVRDTAQLLPVGSYNGLISASAAEHFTAGASLRYASPSSVNGSIGTIAQVPDLSGLLEKFGVRINTFTSGDLKGIGNPFQRMTPEQTAWMQSHVDAHGADFRAWMKAERGSLVPDSMLRGQILSSEEALSAGLLDGITTSMDDVAEALLQLV